MMEIIMSMNLRLLFSSLDLNHVRSICKRASLENKIQIMETTTTEMLLFYNIRLKQRD